MIELCMEIRSRFFKAMSNVQTIERLSLQKAAVFDFNKLSTIKRLFVPVAMDDEFYEE